MRLESLPFEVDVFFERPSRRTRPGAYFLTHAHADHLAGLSSASKIRVFCTTTTAEIAARRTGAPAATFFPLPLHVRTAVSCADAVIYVTLLPASHCIGACMFLFQGPFGTVLHTGDFRVSPSVRHALSPWVRTVDTVFMDCTYCHPSFNFPSMDEATKRIVELVISAWRNGAGDDVFIGGDTLGKEELYASISRQLSVPVIVDADRYRNITEHSPEIAVECFAVDPMPAAPPAQRVTLGLIDNINHPSACVRVVPWWKITPQSVAEWESLTSRSVTAIMPTACPSRLPNDTPGHRVPYSSHSSFVELGIFIQFLQPVRVLRTPETAAYDAKDGKCRDPAYWFRDVLSRYSMLAPISAPSSPRAATQRRVRSGAFLSDWPPSRVPLGATFGTPPSVGRGGKQKSCSPVHIVAEEGSSSIRNATSATDLTVSAQTVPDSAECVPSQSKRKSSAKAMRRRSISIADELSVRMVRETYKRNGVGRPTVHKRQRTDAPTSPIRKEVAVHMANPRPTLPPRQEELFSVVLVDKDQQPIRNAETRRRRSVWF